jgi:Kdo2-lipid IVA lauroyltransferase/acyltransferase
MTVSLLQRVEAGLVAAAFGLMRMLGPVRASNLGGVVLRAIGPRLPVSRVADTNLRLALPGLDATARRRIIRGVWENLGRTVCEMPHVPFLGPTASGPGWELEGVEIARMIAAHPGPVIFFSGHIANWEMHAAVAHGFGVSLSLAYRAPDNPIVDARMAAIRAQASGGAPLFAKGAKGARGMVQHLMSGGRLGMLMDQKMNDGIAVPFFGHPAMTAPALAALALRHRCLVVPVNMIRLGPARFREVCEMPLALPDTGDRQADIVALTTAVNQHLEQWIRERPESWLWLHRRWPKELYRQARASGKAE